MNDADQMWRLRVVELETELALGVGFAAARFFHPLAELEQNHIVSGGGFASGGILDRADEGLSGNESGEE
jgi:hypothetical protein